MGRLPELIEGDGLVLRRWRPEDTELAAAAIAQSAEHLRPWMAWVADEPLGLKARRALIAGWEEEWRGGGDVYLAVLEDGEVVGSTGLHRRRGPGALEIGYWIGVDHLRRGLATRVARLLTAAAFAVEGIVRVEIRHDVANLASGAIPRALGFRLVGEAPNPRAAPADSGTDQVWELLRTDWRLIRV